MLSVKNFRKLSFLVYGLGSTGRSVVKFFNKNNVKNYKVWDDENKKIFKKKRPKNLDKTLNEINYIILSPGVSLEKSINRKKLIKFKNKIITDIDLIFLTKKFKKSIVVTGTNGKSTTCKILAHVLKKNKFRTSLGGNIGTPILDLNIQKDNFLIIEASSFQLAHSKFISPDYAMILNISNDHIDWHGNMKNYINSKFKIFLNQKKNQYAFLNNNLKNIVKKKNLKSKVIIPNKKNFIKLKPRIENFYLKSNINDENMSFVFSLSKILKINEKSFIKSLKSFEGLPHRYEIFLRRKNCIFINDSKATTFQASRLALENSKDIFWIVGGLPKRNDNFNLKNIQKNIVKSYIIGKHVNFFKKQFKNRLKYYVGRTLTNSIIKIFKDIKNLDRKNNTILLSPASASFDQFLNFEKRGEYFKRICRQYAKKYY